jgi:hypothetical protein
MVPKETADKAWILFKNFVENKDMPKESDD